MKISPTDFQELPDGKLINALRNKCCVNTLGKRNWELLIGWFVTLSNDANFKGLSFEKLTKKSVKWNNLNNIDKSFLI